MNPLNVCITYDDNFESMCAHLCQNLRIPGIRVRLNKTESIDDNGFQSPNWYMNLSEKIVFLREKMDEIDYGEVICCCDADIQFFKPEDLFRIKSTMESSDIEYMGQREQDRDHFNGGFFLVKKNEKTLKFLDSIISEDLKNYAHAEQDVINELIPYMEIKSRFLSRIKYLAGCMRFNTYVCSKIKSAIVMHHATCAFNSEEKMEQMNFIRLAVGLNAIDWRVYASI